MQDRVLSSKLMLPNQSKEQSRGLEQYVYKYRQCMLSLTVSGCRGIRGLDLGCPHPSTAQPASGLPGECTQHTYRRGQRPNVSIGSMAASSNSNPRIHTDRYHRCSQLHQKHHAAKLLSPAPQSRLCHCATVRTWQRSQLNMASQSTTSRLMSFRVERP